MNYIILILALIIEVAATTLLKYSDGLKHLLLGCSAYALYGISIYMFGLSIRTINLAVADTIWQGLGIILICLTSLFIFGEHISALQYLFICITMIGVIGIGLVS